MGIIINKIREPKRKAKENMCLILRKIGVDNQQLVCKYLANLQYIARYKYEEFGSHGIKAIKAGKN